MIAGVLVGLVWIGVAHGQDGPPGEVPAEAPPEGPIAAGPVQVAPDTEDSAIEERLTDILHTTRGFEHLEVTVEGGVVFLAGGAYEPEYVDLATELARNTEGVVAVVDRLELIPSSVWDLEPAREELRTIHREVVRALPSTGFAVLMLLIGALASAGAVRLAHPVLRRRVDQPLLLTVGSHAIGVLVFLLWLYLALRVAGLSRLAGTVLGGTGLVGLVVGIAFRAITENFLASLVLSVQQPFREGDLVEVGAWMGYVERLTSRATVLTSLDGSQVQIPNALVFASVVQNYSSTPERREAVAVRVAYQESVPRAQEVALQVLRDHPAVLADPEPWVLVDALGAATVELMVYFWYDGSVYSRLKVRSSVLRLLKRAFQEADITMVPAAGAREIVVRHPVRVDARLAAAGADEALREAEAPSTESEAGLGTEATELESQARKSWKPDGAENLLAAPRKRPADRVTPGAA